MLDAFIIEEIKRRERERERDDRPVVELPLPPDEPRKRDDDEGKPPKSPDRGVVIIDFA